MVFESPAARSDRGSLYFCRRLNGFPFHLSDSQFRVGHQKMPDQGLKGFCMRSYGGGIDDGNENASVRNLGSVASVAADNPANRGANFPSIFEGSHEVSADVFLCVAAANGEDEEHVGLIQPGPAKPIGVTCVPALIVHSGRELRHVVRGRVGFNLGDLAEIADRMGSMPCATADTKEK